MCWKKVIEKTGKFMISVLTEDHKLSIGRLMMLTIFILSSVRWMQGMDVPSTMLTFLMSLLAYVMGTKVVNNVSNTIQKLKSGGVTNVVNSITNYDDTSIKTDVVDSVTNYDNTSIKTDVFDNEEGV